MVKTEVLDWGVHEGSPESSGKQWELRLARRPGEGSAELREPRGGTGASRASREELALGGVYVVDFNLEFLSFFTSVSLCADMFYA